MNRLVLSGGLWTSLDAFLRFGVQFGVSVVLARILAPADFGVYALTNIFVSLSGILIDGGFTSALVQRRDAGVAEQNAVFRYNIIVAGLLALGIVVIAPVIANVYGHPVLRPLLYASSVIMFVSSCGAVPGAMLARRMEFRKTAQMSSVSSLVGAACGVTAAVLGAGIWTFPIQIGTSSLIHTTGYWVMSGWRPSRGFDLQPARGLASFGSVLALSSFLEVAFSSGYPIVLGRLYGVSAVGFYNRGQSLQSLPSNIISGVMQGMLFPTLSSQFGDRDALRSTTKIAVQWAMFLNVPTLMFLSFFSSLIIRVLFGSKWLPAAPVLTILSVGGVLFPLQVINLQVILAQGQSSLFFKLEVLKKALGVTFVAVGCFFGVTGLALSQLTFLVVAFFINSRPLAKLISYSSFDQLGDVLGVLTLSLSVMTVLKLAEPLIVVSDLSRLVTMLLTSGLIYLAGAVVFRIGPARDIVKSFLARQDVSN